MSSQIPVYNSQGVPRQHGGGGESSGDDENSTENTGTYDSYGSPHGSPAYSSRPGLAGGQADSLGV